MNSIAQIDPAALKKKLDAGEKVILIDVREPAEHAEYNIGGSLMPLDSITAKIDQIEDSVPVVFYCKRGIRSQIAIQKLLVKKPFTNLINLTGGVHAWKKLADQR